MRSPTLVDELAKLINDSHQHAWSTFNWVRTHALTYGLSPTATAKWVTPGEPAFVSALLEYPFALGHLSNIIEAHLQPLGLCALKPLVSGIFIHQKPKVRFKPYRGHVELGDLLLVRQHFQSGTAEPEGRAFLMQAKSAKKAATGSLSGKEGQQFALYSNWARPFVFPHKELGPPPDGSTHWNFSHGPANYAESGIYGIVSNTNSLHSSFPGNCTWATGSAHPVPSFMPLGTLPSVQASSSLASVMKEFLLGNAGRPWHAVPDANDHWSSFIVQCLHAAAAWKPYPVQRQGASALPRRRDVMGLVHALASTTVEAWTSSNHPHFSPKLPGRFAHYQRSIAKEMTDSWQESLKNQDVIHDLPPNRDDLEQEPPKGGLSVLYIATYGDKKLIESNESYEQEGTSEPRHY
ncbi:hypothetical protein [Pseudomonas yamanorum]